MCRLCRKDICESCSRFVDKEEMKGYDWCRQWVSNKFPSFMTFLLHENQTRLCYQCHDWIEKQDTMRSRWVFLQNDVLSVDDMIDLSKTDAAYHFLTGLLLEHIRQTQKRSIQVHIPLTDRQKQKCLVHLQDGAQRSRWQYLCSQRLTLDRHPQTMIDTMELLWKLRHCELDQTQMRSVWGRLWQNVNPQRTRLLYYLVQELSLDTYIPQNLERMYGIEEQRRRHWTNWILSPDESTIPDSKTPIWNEVIDVSKVRISRFPSATNPILVRWGDDNKGILWKQETGSVDRMIEYSIAICSESLCEFGILQSKQTWYDVVSLKRGIVAIQMVPNCVSLSSLVEQKKTLLEYVCDQNDGVSVASLRRRLMESIAFSGAISWFFGFGDRHLDNIMVTKEGSLFHIDFGFCFGREPKIGVPRIRITQDMVSSLGQDYWQQCIRKGQQIMDWLRAHITTLRMISDFAEGDSKNHIQKHWEKIENDTVTFEELATESIQSWTTSVHDFFHSSAQSFRSMSSIWTSITRG